jgi:SAM-dependent methyltransferase
MDNGWEASAAAWIADMGEKGDFGRRYVLDPVMIPLALARSPRTALDVGCGEGRFCRQLHQHRIAATGVDPTPGLIGAARARHPQGAYIQGDAEQLPLRSASFELVVSFLSLIDIPRFDAAIAEMARVLAPGGALLIANLTNFNTAGLDTGWVKNSEGARLHYPIDHYLEERSNWIDYRGIRVRNHHRPLGAYMQALLGCGLQLTYFSEPAPVAAAPASKAASYRRAPWFVVMEWLKPG